MLIAVATNGPDVFSKTLTNERVFKSHIIQHESLGPPPLTMILYSRQMLKKKKKRVK